MNLKYIPDLFILLTTKGSSGPNITLISMRTSYKRRSRNAQMMSRSNYKTVHLLLLMFAHFFTCCMPIYIHIPAFNHFCSYLLMENRINSVVSIQWKRPSNLLGSGQHSARRQRQWNLEILIYNESNTLRNIDIWIALDADVRFTSPHSTFDFSMKTGIHHSIEYNKDYHESG